MDKATGSKKTEWTAAATSHLLDLWEENIDGLRGVRKNTHIYKEIGATLELSGGEIKNKIDSLTKRFRKEQTQIGPSGGAPSTWEHYERINKILSTSKAINYKRVMVESTDFTPLHSAVSVDVESSGDSQNEASTSKPKKRRCDKLDRLLEIEEKKLEALNDMANEMKAFHEKIYEALGNNKK